jgi:CRP/FNR family transcriptional regulator, cyclic AMP receptor protein
MSTGGQDVVRLGSSSHWPSRSERTRAPESSPLYTYLLDADDDLAEDLDLRARFAARQLATARVLEVDMGECDLESWFAAVGHGPGLLILDGLVAFDTRIADRTVTQLQGSGNLLQPPSRDVDDMIERVSSWRALSASRLALLDAEFAERVLPWPQIGHTLLRRTQRGVEDLGMLRAISCQPRLEVRLVLFLWHLAARWGRVEPTGIRLMLPLTHRLLGQLVAAERPSISHALGRLADAGLVSGTAGDWHLHGSLDDHLQRLTEGSSTHLTTLRPSRRSTSGRVA